MRRLFVPMLAACAADPFDVKSTEEAGVSLNGVSLNGVACTRVLRADCCGDGTPHMLTGTQVNIYDALGIQTDTQSWFLEGEWTAAGARCVAPGTPTRVQDKIGKTPTCFPVKVSSTCGALADFQSGALLMSETAQ